MARLRFVLKSFHLLATLIISCVVPLSYADRNLNENTEKLTFLPLVYDNGMLHLVLKDLAKGILTELSEHTTVQLTPEIEETVHTTVAGFYDKIKEHPALKTRDIAFSIPPINQTPSSPRAQNHDRESANSSPTKRKRSVMLEICASREEWISPATAQTMQHTTVRLLENQQFHVVRCVSPHRPCNVLAPRFGSECREKNTWTPAYVWSEADQDYNFTFIKMTTSCTCGVATLQPN